MSKSVEKRLEAMLPEMPGDVRAAIAANQQRLTAQAAVIAKLKADRARLAEILGPHLNQAMDIAENRKAESWQPAAISMTIAQAREIQHLLEGR